jgi:TPR repeat protein
MKQIGLAALLFLLICEHVAAGDFAETKKLAERGDPWYQTEMALANHNGQGVPINYSEALYWYRKAALQGLAKAQTNLGVMYAEGQGVPQDYAQAMDWFRKASMQGNSLAQHNLGLMYGRGQGVPQDYSEAYIWESIAASSGHEDAIQNRDICASKLSSEELKTAQRREVFLFHKIQQSKANK